MFDIFRALSHQVSKTVWMYIQMNNDLSEEDSNNSSAEEKLSLTTSSSYTAANKYKLVVTPQALEEEIDISFTEEDQSANTTHKKGKSLERIDKQSNIYGEDEANYIITGFQPSPISKAIRDILIYDIPAKWSNLDILKHLASWGRVISLQVKRQKKYKTVRCKFEMTELFMEYDINKSWMAPLNALPVR
ncbi:hypothetical protein GLOIN_2v1765605 [Rhizophagus clarus]|uniref:Uncharacterized protein n=1 Tax=Rhizophagus clarus TaxID=94130 RepID=A0A8H3QNB0_9GLOM|nr:hypothetical protein GLOIN_2v1765605 [Rhizophagus clarus]